jgi:hypothetical protein
MPTEKEKFKEKRFLRFLHLTKIVRGDISKKETMKAYERSKFKIYLYAKHWYKRTNIIEDMKIILGNRSGISPKFISLGDIFYVLGHITYPHIDERIFLEFINDIHPQNAWKVGGDKNTSIEENIIREMLSILSLTTV